MKIINRRYTQAEGPYQLVLVYFLFCDKNVIGPEINDNTVSDQSLGRGTTQPRNKGCAYCHFI